jgi:large subunit ribosomal protein L24
MSKLRKGDEVIVITGKDKGKKGKILTVLPKKDKIIVEGINIVHKHVKANPQQNKQGGIEQRANPMHISNVKIYDPEAKKGSRVGFRILEDGTKVRYYKSSNQQIDVNS